MAKFKSPRVIMITGAGGYLGSMLCEQFSKSPDLVNIIAVARGLYLRFLGTIRK